MEGRFLPVIETVRKIPAVCITIWKTVL